MRPRSWPRPSPRRPETPAVRCPLPRAPSSTSPRRQAGQLASIVAGAPAGSTIRLANGTYALGGALLNLRAPGVTLRSLSGDAASWCSTTNYQGGDLVAVTASNVTVADLTVQARLLPSHPHRAFVRAPDRRAGAQRARDRSRRAGHQDQPQRAASFADAATIRCSRVELTDQGRPFIRNGCYTGGIDGHQALGWRVRDNVIAGFWCATGLSEHGIHFWTGSRDTLVERNVLRNNARGIGFGLGSHARPHVPRRALPRRAPPPGTSAASSATTSWWSTTRACSARDRAASTPASRWSRCASPRPATTPSTPRSRPSPPSNGARPGDAGRIANNLASHNLRARDGATAAVAGNIQNGPAALVVDLPGSGDLHLRVDAAAAIDQGVVLPPGTVDGDIDLDPRDARPTSGPTSNASPSPTCRAATSPGASWSPVYAQGVTGGCATNPLRFCPDAPSAARRSPSSCCARSWARPTSRRPPWGSSRTCRCRTRSRAGSRTWSRAAWPRDAAPARRRFCPAQTVTRAQSAPFLLVTEEGAGYVPPAATGVFQDVPVVRSLRALDRGAGPPAGHRRLQHGAAAVLSRPACHPRPGRRVPRSRRSVSRPPRVPTAYHCEAMLYADRR